MSTQLIAREFNGNAIRQRTSDGYFDATAMCQATGKRWNNYHRLDSTQTFIDALSLKAHIPVLKLIMSESGRYGGTWIHPYVSINLAQWCSPEFAVQVSEWIFELVSTGHLDWRDQSPIDWQTAIRIGKEARTALQLLGLKNKALDNAVNKAIKHEMGIDLLAELAPPPKPEYKVHESRIQVRQAIANGAETLQEIIQVTDISYDALRKLVQRMGRDGEIKRTKVGKRLKLSAL